MVKIKKSPIRLIFVLFVLLITVLCFSCNSKRTYEENSVVKTDTSTIWKVQNTKTGIEVKAIADDDFDTMIQNGVVLVDFLATWCKPCRMQAPIIEEVATEMKVKVKVFKMDIDQNPSTPSRFGINSIPTLIIFNNGKAVETFVGVTSKTKLVETLNKHLH